MIFHSRSRAGSRRLQRLIWIKDEQSVSSLPGQQSYTIHSPAVVSLSREVEDVVVGVVVTMQSDKLTRGREEADASKVSSVPSAGRAPCEHSLAPTYPLYARNAVNPYLLVETRWCCRNAAIVCCIIISFQIYRYYVAGQPKFQLYFPSICIFLRNSRSEKAQNPWRCTFPAEKSLDNAVAGAFASDFPRILLRNPVLFPADDKGSALGTFGVRVPGSYYQCFPISIFLSRWHLQSRSTIQLHPCVETARPATLQRP